jgi:hypothetical protein
MWIGLVSERYADLPAHNGQHNDRLDHVTFPKRNSLVYQKQQSGFASKNMYCYVGPKVTLFGVTWQDVRNYLALI